MAVEIPGQMVTLQASTDLSLRQFTFVTVDANGHAAAPVAGASVFGVLQNKPGDDEAATVMINGMSKIIAPASTLSVGDLVATSTAGQPVPPGVGDYVVGRITHGSSGGAGRVLTVAIEPIGTT